MSRYYTNMAAFKRAFLTRDIYAEQAERIRIHNETQENIDAEADKRDEYGFGGKVFGGALGWFIGGPEGAKQGAKIGETLLSNYDNTDYSSFLPSQNDYLGKFYMANDLEDYKALVDYADDLEYMHDVTSATDVLSSTKDLFTTDWSESLGMEDDKNWYEKNFREKIKHTKESFQENKMADFMKGFKSISEKPSLTLEEQAFKDTIMDQMGVDVQSLLLDTYDEHLAGGDLGLDSINRALNSIGIQSITQDILDDIIEQNTVAAYEEDE